MNNAPRSDIASDLSGRTCGVRSGIPEPTDDQIRGARLAVAMQVGDGKLDPAGAREILRMLGLAGPRESV